MKRKTEIAVFFSSLAVVGILVIGGILYFNSQKNQGTSSTVPSVVQSQNVQTIPTSTITILAPSASNAPLTPLTLPYSVNAMTSNMAYWPKDWGSISFIKGGISFMPDANPDGANSFLNGASSWSNYVVSTNVSSLSGGWFDIVARVANKTQNFVYCEFGPNGTEIIERVNGTDTQIAHTTASTNNITSGTENFGMKVYGNDIACMMTNQEVLGTRVVDNNEASSGGIGFVIFGQREKQSVQISNISVSRLSNDTIAEPFPPVMAPVVATSTQTITPPPTSPTPPTPVATTTKSLPYSTSVFNASDWTSGWGTESTADGALHLQSNGTITSAAAFLTGSGSWTDYKFTAYVKWVSGQQFELVARRTDGANLLECIFTEINSADTNVTIDMISGGQTTVLTDKVPLVTPAAHMYIVGFPVSMEVQGSNVRCDVDNQTVPAVMNGNLLPRGGIGFITWDSQPGNSEITVTKVSVTPL